MRITANGSKAYIAQGQCNGKTVRVTLARCNEIDVKEARKRCAAATLLMRDGTNPVDRKRQTRVASLTLQDVLEDYLANRRTKFGPLRPGIKKLMRRHIERNLTNWCNKSIASITHAMVATRFREISATAPVQANLAMTSGTYSLRHSAPRNHPKTPKRTRWAALYATGEGVQVTSPAPIAL